MLPLRKEDSDENMSRFSFSCIAKSKTFFYRQVYRLRRREIHFVLQITIVRLDIMTHKLHQNIDFVSGRVRFTDVQAVKMANYFLLSDKT